MPLKIRRIIFIALSIVFIILASFLTLYAQGYKIEVNPNGSKLIKTYLTGSINIKTVPSKADIYIDDKKIEGESPEWITRLDPGDYTIRVEKENYYNWEKKISVKAGMITELKYIWLVNKNPVINNLYRNIKYFSPNGSKLLLIDDKNSLIIHEKESHINDIIFSLDSESEKEAFEKLNGEIYEAKWLDGDSMILISGQINHFLLKNPGKDDQEIIYLEMLEGIKTEDIYIDNDNNGEIFFYKENSLVSLDSSSLTTEELLDGKKILGFALYSSDHLFYINNEDGYLYESNLNDSSSEMIYEDLPSSEHAYEIYPYENNSERCFILDKTSKELFLYEKEEKDLTTIDEEVEDIIFHPNESRMIITHTNRISMYYIEDKENQPIQEAGTLEEISDFSDNILSVAWTNDYEHIIVLLPNRIKLIELDGRDERNSFDIINISASGSNSEGSFYYDDSNNTVYYLNNYNLESIVMDQTSILPF